MVNWIDLSSSLLSQNMHVLGAVGNNECHSGIAGPGGGSPLQALF